MKLRSVLTLLGALVIASPAMSHAADLPDLNIDFYTLDNGLTVILHEDHSTPIVGVNLWYHVGSKNERPGRSGFAHLFEHMMFQGSEHLDDEYFGPLQSVGARINGSTNTDRTNYWEVVPSNHLERALQMEADRMGWLLPAMTQEKLDNQRDVVRNERRQSEGRPYAVFWLNNSEVLYPKGHPYDHSVIGSHEDLEAASLEDVKDFFRTYYTPNNATLSIAGDFDPAQVKAWVDTYFGEIPPGPPVQEVAVWIPELTREKRVRYEDRVQLPRVYYVWHTAPFYHEGDAELDLAGKILGLGKTSRLYKRLVHETQLAQDVAVYQSSSQICSEFTAQVTLAKGVTVDQVEKIVDEEFARFRREGPTREELTRALNDFEAGFIKGLQRVGSWGGKNDRLNRYNHYVGTPDYLKQDYQRYVDATPQSVRDAFATWIDDGRVVFEVHPAGKYKAGATASVDRTTLPEGEPTPELQLANLDRGVLDNGLRTAVMNQPELPLVELQLVIGSGYAADPVQLSGLADMTGEMLLEGTKTYDNFAFANELEKLGTDLNVRTTADFTVISLSSLKKHLDRSVQLMADALLNPAFPRNEFDLRKQRTIVNIERESENANLTAAKVARKVMFGADHPYSRLSTGTAASVEAITLADMKRFAAENYTPNNATMVAVGDITEAELEAVLNKHLGTWQGMAPAAVAFPPVPERTERAVYLVDKPGESQSTISIGHVAVARSNPDWNRITVVNRLLGGFFSSRLNLNIREDKGYSYGTRSGFGENREPGAFTMGGRVQTEVTGPALVEFMREFRGVTGERPVTQEELDFAKGSIVMGYSQEFETNGEISGAMVDMVVFGLPEDYLSSYPKAIEAVTVDEANAIGKQYFHPDKAAVIVVGDVSKIEDQVRELNLGPVYFLDADGNPIEKGTETSPEE